MGIFTFYLLLLHSYLKIKKCKNLFRSPATNSTNPNPKPIGEGFGFIIACRKSFIL